MVCVGGFVASRGQRPRGVFGPFPRALRPRPPCLPAGLCATLSPGPTVRGAQAAPNSRPDPPPPALVRALPLPSLLRSLISSLSLQAPWHLSASAYAGSPAGWCRFPGTSPGERGLPAPAGADAAINSMRRKPPYRAASAATVGRRIRHGKQIVQEFRQGMLAAHHVARTRRSAVSAASSPRRLTSLGEGTHSTSTTSPMRPSAESTIDSPATPHGVD